MDDDKNIRVIAMDELEEKVDALLRNSSHTEKNIRNVTDKLSDLEERVEKITRETFRHSQMLVRLGDSVNMLIYHTSKLKKEASNRDRMEMLIARLPDSNVERVTT